MNSDYLLELRKISIELGISKEVFSDIVNLALNYHNTENKYLTDEDLCEIIKTTMMAYDFSNSPSSKEEYNDIDSINLIDVYKNSKTTKLAFEEALRKFDYVSQRKM